MTNLKVRIKTLYFESNQFNRMCLLSIIMLSSSKKIIRCIKVCLKISSHRDENLFRTFQGKKRSLDQAKRELTPKNPHVNLWESNFIFSISQFSSKYDLFLLFSLNLKIMVFVFLDQTHSNFLTFSRNHLFWPFSFLNCLGLIKRLFHQSQDR